MDLLALFRKSGKDRASSRPAQARVEPKLAAVPRMGMGIPVPPGTKPPAGRPGLQIRQEVSATAHQKPVEQQQTTPYVLPTPMRGVVPPGDKAVIAMDLDIANGYSSILGQNLINEGLAFMGYPYLAELAQRPEYRRLSEIIAKEMTRKWIKLHSTGDEDKGEKIKRLVDAMAKFDVQDLFRRAAELDGFFGRAQIYVDTGFGSDDEELRSNLIITKAKIKQGGLKRFSIVEPIWTYPGVYNARDPLRKDFYRPSHWYVMGNLIHHSRLLTFISREMPDILKPAYSFGGLSLSQMSKPYVDNWLRTRQSVSDTLHSFSVSILHTNMQSTLAGEDLGTGLFARADLFNRIRDNRGLMMLDKDSEEFTNVSSPLGTLDKLQAQAQEHLASVSGIPLVKLLGIAPSGLNASTDGEIDVFYDWIKSQQEHLFRKNLKTVIQLIQLNEFGEIDFEIDFDFHPLKEMSDIDKASLHKTNSDTAIAYINAGVLSPEEERDRLADEEGGLYNGLDPNDLPDPPAGQDPDGGPGGGDPNAAPPDPDLDNDLNDNEAQKADPGDPAERPDAPQRPQQAEDADLKFAKSSAMREALHPDRFGSPTTKGYLAETHARIDAASAHHTDPVGKLAEVKATVHDRFSKIHRYINQLMDDHKSSLASQENMRTKVTEVKQAHSDAQVRNIQKSRSDQKAVKVLTGAVQQAMGQDEFDPQVGYDLLALDDFAEHLHPRDADGKFTAGAGSSKSSTSMKSALHPDNFQSSVTKDFLSKLHAKISVALGHEDHGVKEDLLKAIKAKTHEKYGKVHGYLDHLLKEVKENKEASEPKDEMFGGSDDPEADFGSEVDDDEEVDYGGEEEDAPAPLSKGIGTELSNYYDGEIPHHVVTTLAEIEAGYLSKGNIDDLGLPSPVKNILKNHFDSVHGKEDEPTKPEPIAHTPETQKMHDAIQANLTNILPANKLVVENKFQEIKDAMKAGDLSKVKPIENANSVSKMKVNEYLHALKNSGPKEKPPLPAPAKEALEAAEKLSKPDDYWHQSALANAKDAWESHQNGDSSKILKLITTGDGFQKNDTFSGAVQNFAYHTKQHVIDALPAYALPKPITDKIAALKKKIDAGTGDKSEKQVKENLKNFSQHAADGNYGFTSQTEQLGGKSPSPLQKEYNAIAKEMADHAKGWMVNPHVVSNAGTTPPPPTNQGPSPEAQAAAAKKIAQLPHYEQEQYTVIKNAKGEKVKAKLATNTADIPGEWYAKATAAFGGDHSHGSDGNTTHAVTTAYNDYAKHIYSKMSSSQIHSAEAYQDGLYTEINKHLNGVGQSSQYSNTPQVTKAIADMRAAIASSPVPADTPVYRGMKCDLKALTGFNDPAEAVGKAFVHKNFASVSRSKQTSSKFSGGKTLLKFNLPAGSKGLMMKQQNYEHEIVLDSHSMFRIDKIEQNKEGHNHVIHVTYLGHKEP